MHHVLLENVGVLLFFFNQNKPVPSLYGLQHTTTLRSMNICVGVNNLSGTREPCPGATGESGLHLQSFPTHQPHPAVLPHRRLLKKDGRLERTVNANDHTAPSLYQPPFGHSSEVKEWFLETQYCDTEKAANSSKSRQDIF